MPLNDIIRIFLPKDKIFYDIFENIVANLKEMGSVFKLALNEKDLAKRTTLLKSMEDKEHLNDDYTHKIFVELGQNFITPFDREDIHALVTSLDDIADYIHDTSKKILNYNIVEIDEFMIEFGEINQKAIDSLANAVTKLRSMKNISQIKKECVAINSMENAADDTLDKAIIHLFSNKNITPIDVIKLKDVYENLEVISDKCEDVSNIIESIIIKYT